MYLFMAEQNGVQVFGVAKDAEDFHDHIVEKAGAGEVAPTFGYLHFNIQEITVDGYEIILRANRKKGTKNEAATIAVQEEEQPVQSSDESNVEETETEQVETEQVETEQVETEQVETEESSH